MASIRDLTCINSVAHMAEYGKYEEEFIVYGNCCLEENKLVYRITPQYEELTRFEEQAIYSDMYLSPIYVKMNRCVVQTGQRESLLYDTEIQLAQVLQEIYPRVFFVSLRLCATTEPVDSMKALFDALRFQMDGIFSNDYLQLFNGLVLTAYQAKLLTKDSVAEIQQWCRRIRNQMEYDIVVKKPFQRTFYGIAYLDTDGSCKYKINAQEFTIREEQRKLKQKCVRVTPIFHKTYWYDYGIEPKTIKEIFKKELQTYYGEMYWSYWNTIKNSQPVVSPQIFSDIMQQLEEKAGKEAKDALLEYGYDWNVLTLK